MAGSNSGGEGSYNYLYKRRKDMKKNYLSMTGPRCALPLYVLKNRNKWMLDEVISNEGRIETIDTEGTNNKR